MGRQNTIDTDEPVANGLEALNEMTPRRHNDSRNELVACPCGNLTVVPKGHDALDGDGPVLCHDCDKPLGAKMYDALAH